MALFEALQGLSPQFHGELVSFYESGSFPIEVRNLLANYIESGINLSDTSEDHQRSQIFVNGLLNRLEEKLKKQDELPFFIKHKVNVALQDLKERDPTEIHRRVRKCLKFEMELVQRAQNFVSLDQNDPVMENLNVVKKRGESGADILKQMIEEQDAFEINCTEKQSLEDHLNLLIQQGGDPTNDPLNNELRGSVNQKTSMIQGNLQRMMKLQADFFVSLRTTINSVGDLQNSIIQEHLSVWKFQQQKAANGLSAIRPVSLGKVQLYLESLAEILWRLKLLLQQTEQLKQRNPVFANDPSASSEPPLLLEEIHNLLKTMLNEAFLVEEQPQQVMKKGNKFSLPPRVSLLISNLHIQMSSPQVTACIIREAQARSLPVTESVEVAMPLTNGVATLEPFTNKAGHRRLSAKFCSLQLREIRRADKRSPSQSTTAGESVMEEKLCMLFESVLQLGSDLKVRVRTLSLPVVVTSHGSQDATAEAAILWDNAFGGMNRLPFQVPQRVAWADVAQVMSAKFLILTGKQLSEENLRCLKHKAMRGNDSKDTITWSEFAKESLPQRNFSFWTWVYAALKNIERKETHLKEIWSEGHLMGFVEREEAEAMLALCPPGTFLLRFSDSKAGAISISAVSDTGEVFAIAPMDEGDMKQKRLADCIRDLDKLKFLFPGIPKDTAFGKHYSQEPAINPATGRPYVHLVPTIPENSVSGRSPTYSGGFNSNPGTPMGCGGMGMGHMMSPQYDGNSHSLLSPGQSAPIYGSPTGSNGFGHFGQMEIQGQGQGQGAVMDFASAFQQQAQQLQGVSQPTTQPMQMQASQDLPELDGDIFMLNTHDDLLQIGNAMGGVGVGTISMNIFPSTNQ